MTAVFHPLRERLNLAPGALPWASLGQWPTPITQLVLEGQPVWLKREDLAHPTYGGNKVRTLEVLLGDAVARGVTTVWAAGAYGSNHAVATLVHAPRVGLTAGALLFPQPASPPAVDNLRSALSLGARVLPVANVAMLPLAMLTTWRRERSAGGAPWMMPPGGASPLGTLGALSAVFELAEQLAHHAAPPPATLVVAVGSTCTTAGLLAGLALAHELDAWPWPLPTVHAVRVTPWPITSSYRISALARRALELLERLRRPSSRRAARSISRAQLAAHLVVDGAQLGGGYGRPTAAGQEAAAAFASAGGPPLDCVYAAKSGAALLGLLRAGHSATAGPLLYWSTKSFAPPPVAATRPATKTATQTATTAPAAPFARWLASAG
ncbi:MAG: pyridoxal-phosphate dependent enzyme [Myxococcales bacterium]|nr:pyridoxal-phosphate dependent enzyme [Myxococcales bacterium]